MRRRPLVAAVLGGASLTAPAQPRMRSFRVGILAGATRATTGYLVDIFRATMRELGYEEGRNVGYEERWANGRLERLPDLAAELVKLRVDVILTSTGIVTEAARNATASIPIVMASGERFVGKDWIATLAKPGGNLTGLIYSAGNDMVAKRLELLKQTVPTISSVMLIAELPVLPETLAGAKRLGLKPIVVLIRADDDLDKALTQAERDRPDALSDSTGILGIVYRQRLTRFLLDHRMPSISSVYDASPGGFLLSYHPNLPPNFRRAAVYVDRILKGTPPGELPIEQPIGYALAINLSTARALGITVPQTVLLRADEVIE